MYYYDSSIVHVVEHSIVRSIYGEVRDVVPTFATPVPILSRHSRKRPIFVQDPIQIRRFAYNYM
eukprot:COSAG02_NODE_1355_length_13099_cov_10.562923_5_plen_64_part_00